MVLWYCIIVCLALGQVVIGDAITDIITALEKAVTQGCDACPALLAPLQTLSIAGDDALSNALVGVCVALKLEDPDVCAGAIGEEAPILAHDLRHISLTGRTATMFCEAVFGICPTPPPMPFNFTFPKPAPKNPKRFTTSGRTPFQVVHFSDVHIDRQYTVGSNANCTKNICCRDFPDSPPANQITDPALPFGNSKCDSPGILADSMLHAVKTLGRDAEFALFTGDVVEGAIWLVNRNEVTDDLEEWNAQMSKGLGIAVYPSIGNHDVAPVNAFPRTTTPSNNSQWVFDIQSAGWRQWIQSTASKEVDHNSGCYSIKVPGRNLRVISINTQYFYKQNFWFYDSDVFQPDPNGVLSFLISQLQLAEDAGERAWIIGHIPLGKADAFNDQSHYFNQIIQRYENTIAGQFYGHSHKDEFEIGYSNYSNQNAHTANFIALVAPALTPTSGNPAFKIYDIDPESFEVMDSKIIFTNISSPHFQSGPTWEVLYSARELYGSLVSPSAPLSRTTSLSPAFWHNLTTVFEANDTAFQQWNAFKSRNLIGEVPTCTGDCKTVSICAARALRAEDNCSTAQASISFKKRNSGLGVGSSEDECHGSAIVPITKRLATLTARELQQAKAILRDN